MLSVSSSKLLFQGLRKALIALGVFLIGFLILHLSSLKALSAPNSSSWVTSPNWNTNSGGSNSEGRSRTATKKSDFIYNVSPFSPGSNNLALDVGQVFLMGNLSDNYSDSIGTQLHYTYGVSEIFGFDASLGYSGHSDGRFSMTSLLTGLRTNLSWYDRVIPYAIFGLGFYRPSFQVTSAATNQLSSVSPMLFGIHVGPGVDLEITKSLYFGAGLTFHDIFGANRLTSTGQQLEVGGTYTSFLLHTGVTF